MTDSKMKDLESYEPTRWKMTDQIAVLVLENAYFRY